MISKDQKKLFEKEWLDKFCSYLKPGDELVDIGCGSGSPIAKYFIENNFKVVGVDYSSAMIDICKNRYPSYEWIVQDMCSLSLDRCFNAIIAWNSFFHLTRQQQKSTIARISDHLNNGGIFMTTVGPENGETDGFVNGKKSLSCQSKPGRISAGFKG